MGLLDQACTPRNRKLSWWEGRAAEVVAVGEREDTAVAKNIDGTNAFDPASSARARRLVGL